MKEMLIKTLRKNLFWYRNLYNYTIIRKYNYRIISLNYSEITSNLKIILSS